MEFLSSKLNSVYAELKGNVEFGYSNGGQPLSCGLPSSEYIMVKPYYSPTGDPHTIVITPSMSIIQYLYEPIEGSWKALKYQVCTSMKDTWSKLNKLINPPEWK